MVLKICLLTLSAISGIALLFLAFYPRIFNLIFGIDDDEPLDFVDRIVSFLFSLVCVYMFYEILHEINPPPEIEENGYSYVLTDEPEEDIECYGHRYVLKDGEN